ncbi:MAG: YkgJ family cysteine cluster protein [Methanoregulaceae archaeon]|nr:YkgJ family cysteine cluster protein [Methanoregulaceae archaeon]
MTGTGNPHFEPGSPVPIRCRISALVQERNRLFGYPMERLAEEIRSTRFECTGCGACCTRAVTGYIGLSDPEAVRLMETCTEALEPAPDPEFCDQDGILYVSGYAVRTKGDPGGSCWFLEGNRCGIYDRRFSVCRIYPHMLRRGTDGAGSVEWRMVARRDRHGRWERPMGDEACLALACEIKEYENAFLTRQIDFLETVHDFFRTNGLRHDQELFYDRAGRFREGEPVPVRIFHEGTLEEWMVAGGPERL